MEKPSKHDILIHDTFVTAVEGGIGYWSEAYDYHWSLGDGVTEDYAGFGVEVEDAEDERKRYTIDRAVIERGFEVARTEGDVPYLGPRTRAELIAAWLDPDEADIDSIAADIVVQLGLFGKVVYG